MVEPSSSSKTPPQLSDKIPVEKTMTEEELKEITNQQFVPGSVRLYREFRYNTETTGAPPNKLLGNVLARVVYNMFHIRQILNVETFFHKTLQKHRAAQIALSDVLVDYYFVGKVASESEAFTTVNMGVSLQGALDRGFGDVPIVSHIWGEKSLRKAIQLPVNVMENVPLFLKHYAIFSIISSDTIGQGVMAEEIHLESVEEEKANAKRIVAKGLEEQKTGLHRDMVEMASMLFPKVLDKAQNIIANKSKVVFSCETGVYLSVALA